MLTGTNEDDEIYGFGGPDQLFGAGGNDKLFGGEGMTVLCYVKLTWV